MNRRQKEALAEIGVTTKKYHLDSPYDPDWTNEEYDRLYQPPIWGLAIYHNGSEEPVAVIETSGRSSGDPNYHLRRSPRGIDIAVTRTQREAIARWVRREYRV